MANFSARVKEKRECTWKLIEEQALIVNVKCEFLKVMRGKSVDRPCVLAVDKEFEVLCCILIFV